MFPTTIPYDGYEGDSRIVIETDDDAAYQGHIDDQIGEMLIQIQGTNEKFRLPIMVIGTGSQIAAESTLSILHDDCKFSFFGLRGAGNEIQMYQSAGIHHFVISSIDLEWETP